MNSYSRAINDEDYHDMANELGVSVKEVLEMNQRMSGHDISLNRSVGYNNEGIEAIDFLPEKKPDQEISLLRKQDMQNKKLVLAKAMQILNNREIEILTSRKLSYYPKTLENLSMKYNISKERVRQIENRALEKIQDYILTRISKDGQFKILTA